MTPSGLSGAFGKLATSGVGAGIGHILGLPYGHELGAFAGYVGAEQIRELLASPAGRDFMEKTLEESYRMGTGKAVKAIGPVLSIFARGLMAGGEPEPEK